MASDKTTVERYFNHVVLNYNVGDIQKLLSIKLNKCGPLLAATVSGIDTLGGMMQGFGAGSGPRSIAFMEKHLGMDRATASMLYSCARCGLAHEGVTKLFLGFFVHYERLDRGTYLYREKDALWLHVTELAWSYLDAIEAIGKDIHSHLCHTPQPNVKDEQAFKQALSFATKDIADFEYLMDSSSAGGKQYLGSWSPYAPEDKLCFFKIPPL